MNIKRIAFESDCDKVVENLIKSLALNTDEGEDNALFMKYVAAKFSAAILLNLKATSEEENIEEDFFRLVKEQMQARSNRNKFRFGASPSDLGKQYKDIVSEFREKRKQLLKTLGVNHQDLAEDTPTTEEVDDDMAN